MLVREATHRVKNYLAVVQSLIRVSAGRHDHTREFAESIAGRVEALARAIPADAPRMGWCRIARSERRRTAQLCGRRPSEFAWAGGYNLGRGRAALGNGCARTGDERGQIRRIEPAGRRVRWWLGSSTTVLI